MHALEPQAIVTGIDVVGMLAGVGAVEARGRVELSWQGSGEQQRLI